MNLKEEVRKFAEENGLAEAEVLKVVKRAAICKKIEKIAFRADTALCTELSLIYDDMALCEMPDERGKIAEGRLSKALASQNALHDTLRFVAKVIMEGEAEAAVPDFFRELEDIERPDDDETIAGWLIRRGNPAAGEETKILREYVEREFDDDGDEHE